MIKSQHLLITRFSALGDVAMLVPVVYSLAKQYPDLRITVLSQDFILPLFSSLPSNVDFIGANVKKDYKGFFGLIRLFKEIKKKNHFTAVADMHDVLRTKVLRLLFTLSGVKTKHIDKHRSGKKALCRLNNKRFVQQPTSFDNYKEVLSKLGYSVSLDFDSIIPVDQHVAKDVNSIGIAPFAAHKGKIYPLEKMSEVIRLLIAKGKKIYLFGGGKGEMETFHNWQDTFGNDNVVVVGDIIKKDLLAEIRLMSSLSCMISMDSANQHLASLCGTRVVSIWGATHPYAGFKAYGQSDGDCVQLEMPCRPCSVYGSKPCVFGNYPCLSGISPQSIVNKI